MQSSMELEPQNGTAGIGEISKEGYEELHRIGDKLKKEMRGLYQTDMVGALLKLPDYLDMERHESAEEKKNYQKLTNFLDGGKYPFNTKDTIMALLQRKADSAEGSRRP